MGGEGPIEKNRPSPIKWETFTSFSGLSPLLWETFTIFGQDLHRCTLFPTLRAPKGPQNGPIEAFAASFAPNGPSDGPLRAFSCSAYSAGKLRQGTTVFCLPRGQACAPPLPIRSYPSDESRRMRCFSIIFRAPSFYVR